MLCAIPRRDSGILLVSVCIFCLSGTYGQQEVLHMFTMGDLLSSGSHFITLRALTLCIYLVLFLSLRPLLLCPHIWYTVSLFPCTFYPFIFCLSLGLRGQPIQNQCKYVFLYYIIWIAWPKIFRNYSPKNGNYFVNLYSFLSSAEHKKGLDANLT